MKNWTIGKRIIFGFAAILLLVAILAVTNALSLRSIRRDLALVTEDSLPGVTAIGEIESLIQGIRSDVLRHMLAAKAEDKKAVEDAIDANKLAIQTAMEVYEKTIHLDEDRENFKQLQAAREDYIKLRGPLLELSRAGKTQEMITYNETILTPAYNAYMAVCNRMFKWNADYGRTGASRIQHTLGRAHVTVLGLSGLSLAVGATFAWFIVVGVSRMLTRVAGSLNDGADQVTSAAGQVSASSQSLAEGASEQAASLEETSSSLEEMSSMTQRNASNAQQANELAKAARAAADRGAADMQAMSGAMDAIKHSSDDIAKILKTIDEIAFQTNLLALNAAVEAARAGEAGMGFAVVADEVRNLAQRAATAAKETAEKIDGAISKSAQGVEISSRVAAALSDIVAKARQVDELVSEVASASREQSQGITQINTAVSQMDKVTQSNAANAEESAAAAEELNAQAEAMKDAVRDLLRLVDGTAAGAAASQAANTAAPAPAKPVAHAAHHGPGSRMGKNGHPRPTVPLATAQARATGPSAIPLEGDFRDF